MPDKIEIGNILVERGEFKKGSIKGIELANGVSIDIPLMVINGVEDGPTLLLMSTQHGIEIQGIEVIHKIIREKLSFKHLRGAVIGIPVGNPLAFMHQQYLSWTDNLDVGRVNATLPNGNATEKLAYALWTEAWSIADLIINIHCNTRPDSLIYQAINVSNPKTKEKLKKMAEVFGVTTIFSSDPIQENALPTLNNLAAQKGTPVILEELIDGRWISEPSTSVGVKGVLNIMKAFNMIDGNIEPQIGIPIVPGVNRFHGMAHANHGGLIRFLKKPGEPIKKGEVYAEVYNLYGDTVEQIEMPVDGYIWAYPCAKSLGTSGGLQVVQTGSNVAYVFTHEG
ncbi:MAG: succinylglutamate desuccinylase/aspartoacylase family protein [Candidatus Bathyarchaeota archaeon]|nr:MAG: succinylglutamate desuccinylase/aspartoacylase family protein [Candidatus Bathyarchaeota archaeon]